VHAAQRGQRAGPVRRRHRVDHVALPGQQERGPGHPAQDHGDPEHQHRRAECRHQHRQPVDEATEEQRAPFADARDQGARGQGRDQHPGAEQGDDQGGRAHVGTQVACPERQDRHHRAVAGGVDDRRAVRRQRDVTQPERARVR